MIVLVAVLDCCIHRLLLCHLRPPTLPSAPPLFWLAISSWCTQTIPVIMVE